MGTEVGCSFHNKIIQVDVLFLLPPRCESLVETLCHSMKIQRIMFNVFFHEPQTQIYNSNITFF